MSTYDALKDAVKLAQKVDNAELIQRLLDAQKEALEMQEELQTLRERVRELERQDDVEESLVFDDGVYWRGPEGGEQDGPFCQLCWDRDHMLIRLQDYKNGYFGCQSCDNTVDHPAATGGDSEAPVWRGR